MPRFALATACLAALLTTATTTAQPPIVRETLGGDTLKRLPNDNVEGTIWEYKGELEKGELEGSKEARIAGMFRLEEEAVFAVGESIRLPSKEDFEKLLEDLRKGRAKSLKLPSFKPKRIGDFTISRSGRLTLKMDDESDDPNALFGTMILRPKKGQTSVYLGDFREKEGKKTIRTWQMTVRKVQD
ncbi:MAG: hypothetical protein AAF589_08075 [Planctomycetota bacterium]